MNLKSFSILALCTLSSICYSKPVIVDDKELQSILLKLEKIEQKLDRLNYEISVLHSQSDSANVHSRPAIWGCYMSDIKAGGIYATGLTKAEAKGKTLEICTKKEGGCFTSAIRCDKSQ